MIIKVKSEHHHLVTGWLNAASQHGGWEARAGRFYSTITVTSEFLRELAGEAVGQYVLHS